MHRLAAFLAFEQSGEGAVEAQQVDDHPLEARAGDVARLAEQAARRAAVLEVVVLALDREAHVRRLARDAEAVEQARERRVVAVVHHDEAGVDVMRLVRGIDADRVRVPAGVGVRLVDDDLVLAVQQVRGDEPRHAGADDRDPHAAARLSCARRITCVTVRRGPYGGSFDARSRRRASGRGNRLGRRATRPRRTNAPNEARRHPNERSPAAGRRHERASEPVEVHPRALRGVLALAEGRRAVHRRPPRRGRVPDGRGARAPREHVELDGRALLTGARVRGLSRAAGGRARGIPPRARDGRRGRAELARRRCSRSTRTSSRRRSRPTT